MKIEFQKSFEKDLRKLRDVEILARVQQVIESTEIAERLSELSNLKKLEAEDDYYRIRIKDYRIGVIVDENTVTFVRVLHRKDIYKYFP
jgi:mRNA interferase RelE/StbE